jgi:hypothetical protein
MNYQHWTRKMETTWAEGHGPQRRKQQRSPNKESLGKRHCFLAQLKIKKIFEKKKLKEFSSSRLSLWEMLRQGWQREDKASHASGRMTMKHTRAWGVTSREWAVGGKAGDTCVGCHLVSSTAPLLVVLSPSQMRTLKKASWGLHGNSAVFTFSVRLTLFQDKRVFKEKECVFWQEQQLHGSRKSKASSLQV